MKPWLGLVFGLASLGAAFAETASTKPTVYIVGDSTAANDTGGLVGWGVPFPTYFDLSKVEIQNRARGGRSSRTYFTEGLWDQVLTKLKSGDYVLLQFGHNDGGAVDDPQKPRGSLPGLGEETREVDNQVTHKHEVIHTFGWYMRKYVADTLAKGAHPILLSLTVRNIWNDGKVERGPGRYGEWTADIAKAEGVPFLDLTPLIAATYERMGPDKVAALFPKDHTHNNAQGADLNASLVVSGLKRMPGQPLVGWLSEKGRAVP